jgi:hypothetical protein
MEQAQRPSGLTGVRTAFPEEVQVLAELPARGRVNGSLHRGEMAAEPGHRWMAPGQRCAFAAPLRRSAVSRLDELGDLAISAARYAIRKMTFPPF